VLYDADVASITGTADRVRELDARAVSARRLVDGFFFSGYLPAVHR